MSYVDGRAAAVAGEPVSVCPFGPSDPAGAEWRRGWLQGESARRVAAGDFGASAEDRARAAADAGGGELPAVLEVMDAAPPARREAHRDHVHVSITADDLVRWAEEVVPVIRAAVGEVMGAAQRLAAACAEVAAALPDQHEDDDASTRVFVCHRHGEQATRGFCRPCQRSVRVPARGGNR